MQKLLDEREKEEFESFKNINDRVPSMPDAKETVRKRIVQELKGEDVRTRLFTQ
jgi:predicted nucleic acid-binding OB-fold protein